MNRSELGRMCLDGNQSLTTHPQPDGHNLLQESFTSCQSPHALHFSIVLRVHRCPLCAKIQSQGHYIISRVLSFLGHMPARRYQVKPVFNSSTDRCREDYQFFFPASASRHSELIIDPAPGFITMHGADSATSSERLCRRLIIERCHVQHPD